MLTMAIVEFSTDTDIQFELAMNDRDRLRAEYLAYSASNLMQLELQLEKTAKSLLANAPAAMSAGMSGPLCQQFPMSSALLRGIFTGGSDATTTDQTAATDEVPAKKSTGMINAFQQQAAQDFLNFAGDFDGQCVDLQSRINLNAAYDLDPLQQVIAGSNAYDTQKLIIMALLQEPAYREIMADYQGDDIRNLVRNIADWVDKNDQINELGGIQSGAEEGIYRGDAGLAHAVKNGKMLSMDEVFLVKGVRDDWFEPVAGLFTVYGDSKVNVCMSDSNVIMALLARYVTSNSRFSTVDLKKPEMQKKLLAAISVACQVGQPQPTKIAQDVDTVLGGGSLALVPGQPTTSAPTTPNDPTTTGGAASNFAQYITVAPRWYELKTTGQVGDVVVHLIQVWDVKESDPKQWKLLFSKME